MALAAAGAGALFLAAAVLASGGRWSSLHTWYALGVGVAAVLALACYALAGRVDPLLSPRGDSPGVTHLRVTPSQTLHEVRK